MPKKKKNQNVLFISGLFQWLSDKEFACNAGDPVLIPGSRRSPGVGNGNPPYYSCLEDPIDRGAWQATVHGVTRVRHDLVNKPPPQNCLF